MNKKGQLGGVLYLLALIVIAGILLATFQPTINEFRLDLINNIDNYPDQANTFSKIILYSLNPIIWIGYIFLSILMLFIGIRQLQE